MENVVRSHQVRLRSARQFAAFPVLFRRWRWLRQRRVDRDPLPTA